MKLDALVADFDMSRFSNSSPRFDIRQLMTINRRVLHEASFEQVAPRLPDGATEAFWLAVRGNLDLLSEARELWEVVAGDIVPPVIDGEAAFFRQAMEALPPAPWDETVWGTWTAALREMSGRKGKALFLPLRMALTGEDHGPELKALLPLIGRERALARLEMMAR